MTVTAACEAAGMSPAGDHKALKRPDVQDYMQGQVALFLGEADRLRATAKARALEIALELMETAKSETVRARMAEFLPSEGKAPQVAVHVDVRVNEIGAGGYEYLPPGAQVVEAQPEQASDKVQDADKAD